MKIQVLDPCHYLAILSLSEANSLGLSPDTGKPWPALTLGDRLAAARIFSEISRRYAINISKHRILLRLSHIPSGKTLLFFSLLPKKRHTLHPIHPERWGCFDFYKTEDLFRSACLLCRQFPHCNTWLYQWPPNGWRLLLCADLKSFPALRCRVGEYGRFAGGGPLLAASTREHGTLLCERAAQRLCGKSFYQD